MFGTKGAGDVELDRWMLSKLKSGRSSTMIYSWGEWNVK